MASTAAVKGAGLVTGVWKKLEKAVIDAGGNENHLARLDKQEADALFARFALDIVRTLSEFDSFLEMAMATGCRLYREAAKLDKVPGQHLHTVSAQTKLVVDCPDNPLSMRRIVDRYSGKMADLSELLHYAIVKPEDQRHGPIAIVLPEKTRNLQGDATTYWCVVLSSISGQERMIDIFCMFSDTDVLSSGYRYLVRG